MMSKQQLIYLFNNGVIDNNIIAEELLNLLGIYIIPQKDGTYKMILEEKEEGLPF